MSTREVRIFPDIQAIACAAAEEFVRLKPKTVALSGGSTPRLLYRLLAARKDISWSQTHFFFGDERHVPPDHPDSNYNMARESLLEHIPVSPGNVHRIHAENPDAAVAAAGYVAELQLVFGSELPRFDLVLLGMGPDGHTASLFPGTTALQERERWVVSTWVDKMHSDRITMTLPVLNNAANIIFMAGGLEKAEVLKPVLSDAAVKTFPSQFIEPVNGRLLWMVDQAAAKFL